MSISHVDHNSWFFCCCKQFFIRKFARISTTAAHAAAIRSGYRPTEDSAKMQIWRALVVPFCALYGTLGGPCLVEGVFRGFRGGEPADGQPVVPPASSIKTRPFSESDASVLEWEYGSREKDWPYVGSEIYLKTTTPNTHHYYNSLAVFPNQSPKRLHGYVGLYPNGTQIYRPGAKPPAVTDDNRNECLKDGGFYLKLSDHLPVNRDAYDQRPRVCKRVNYDLPSLDDVTIIITFFNEPLSTLLRSVHSVLNWTPPPLLREIILVDDHSNKTDLLPGGPLDAYLRVLPKVKLLRQPSRHGLVTARVAGAQIARAPVLVILDSHIEVAPGWLEPQLERLKQSPESIVFPQIPGIKPEDFTYLTGEGIGCRLSFKWVMQEKAQGLVVPTSPDPIQSPTMAGGLFAMRTDWFWELGGYDEEFSMWGAENVEMPFRAWMCGGKVECTPCAYVYHIYRSGGAGYKSPPQSIWKNRLRTARIWADEFYELTSTFIGHPNLDLGPLDHMMDLKDRLHCKNFTWFLKHIDHDQPIRSLDGITLAGEIRNGHESQYCIDTLSHNKPGDTYGSFYCHGSGGTQGFLRPTETKQLHSYTDETLCLGGDLKLVKCRDASGHWDIENGASLVWSATKKCLSMRRTPEGMRELVLEPCTANNPAQQWRFKPFQRRSQM